MYLLKNVKITVFFAVFLVLFSIPMESYADWDKVKWGMTRDQFLKAYNISSNNESIVELPTNKIHDAGVLKGLISDNLIAIVRFFKKEGAIYIEIPSDRDFYELKLKLSSVLGPPVYEIYSCPKTSDVLCFNGAQFIDKKNRNCISLIMRDVPSGDASGKNPVSFLINPDKSCKNSTEK